MNLDDAIAPHGLVVAALLKAVPDAMAIYVFGSRLHGTALPDSDLDLAVLVPGYAASLVLWETAQDLAGKLECDVDLLDLRDASTVMQYQVLTTGRRLWAMEAEADAFECFVLNEKLELDVARAELLRDIEREGSVHGR